MEKRSVEIVVSPREPHFVGDGFRVHNFIPSGYRLDMQRMNPFIMLDYNSKFHFDPSDTPKGVGVHPHRGFETVTIAYKGKVEHHDSSGGGGVIGEGDVQWMTAASGVLHKEFHEKEWSKTGGEFQMVQLWVNLPAKDKMSKPKYQALENSKINRFKSDDKKTEIEIIAGEYKGVKGSASTFTPLHLYNVKMAKDAKTEMNLPKNFNTALLVIEGSITINGTEKVDTNHFALMDNDGESFTIDSNENAVYLVLSGEPINEPIAAHGPFVMNTRQELVQAFEDFNQGRFGTLQE
ncbi:MAG TPA: pirin family protein [Bacteroidia bacterium]|nr:pirin family protein [Bacteroidia bacterium]QQR96074.1 MAG: pirin family protein [Bacteroidota bacterium]MBP7713666.1 pirin family protein [Bacteroidia bacterium]MBP8667471.1 pirin family protein [Bacteroidia bacterium]HOZ82477.1 pirin family protein [Bacteroidia bacterium]